MSISPLALPLCGRPSLPLSPSPHTSLSWRRPITSSAPLPAISARKTPGRCCRLKVMAELTNVSGSGYGGGDGESEAILDDPESGLGRSLDLEPGGWEHLINKSSKWLMALMLGGAIVLKHDSEGLWAASGAILNTWSSIGLKLLLNQERPTPSLRSSPGMPSSHAQSLFYGVVFLLISMFQWLGINAISIMSGTLIFMAGSYLTWLRVSQQLHTISQVVVGAVLGTVISAGWIYVWHAIVLDAYTSFLWVRIAVISGSVCLCTAFFLYISKYWIPRDS